jgi:hypothetical protein
MQLHATIRTKTAVCFWLIWRLFGLRDLKNLLNLPPNARFQYRYIDQLTVCCSLPLISRHPIFGHPPASDRAHQLEFTKLACADLLQVMARKDKNGMFLICPFHFENICDLAL